ncbi:MAG: hypothetical protein ACI845_001065 [Gammaproteobacteria bacterium]
MAISRFLSLFPFISFMLFQGNVFAACSSAEGWQFLASDPANQLEIKFKIHSSGNVGWGVLNNSSQSINQ